MIEIPLSRASVVAGRPFLRMGLFQHIEELRRRLKIVFAAFIIFFVLCLSFGVRAVDLGGVSIPILWPDVFNSVATQMYRRMADDLLPTNPNVTLIVTAPAEAFLVQVKVAFFLAFLFSMPVIVYEVGAFVSPALYEREKRVLRRIALPAAGLFAAGAAMAYSLILPFTFGFLYEIAVAFGAQPFLDLGEFFDFVLLFMVAFGLGFELPLVMFGLNAIGLVRADFWKKHWRLATMAIFAFGAIITPDGSGVTMLLVAIPMLFLYLGGYLACRTRERRKERKGDRASWGNDNIRATR